MQKSLSVLYTVWYDLVDRAEGAEEELGIAEGKVEGWKHLYERAVTDDYHCAGCAEWHSLNHPRLGSELTALTYNEEAHYWKVNSDAYERLAKQWERTAARWRARALGLGDIEDEPPEPIAASEPTEVTEPEGSPRLTFTQKTVTPPHLMEEK